MSSRLLRAAFPGLLGLILVTPGLASAQSYGTIKGRLVWGGDSVPSPKVLIQKGDANAKDAAVCAAESIPADALVIDPKTKGVQFGFAYVTKPVGTNPNAEKELISKSAEVEIDQKGCRFVPHAVAVHKDQALLFKNSDAVGHNVRYSTFNNGAQNQMVAQNGKMESKFASGERNPSEVKCDIHPWMSGQFMVFDHPFFAVTGPDGSFEIKGVPAGTQSFIVRHETRGFVTAGASKGIKVEVKAGETTDLGDIKLLPKE